MKKKIFHAMIVAVFDIVIISVSYAFGLLVRFDLSWSHIPPEYLSKCFRFLPVATLVTLLIFLVTRMYSFVWYFVSLKDSYRIFFASILANVATAAVSMLMDCRLPISVYIITFLAQFMAMLVMRFSVKMLNAFLQERIGVKNREISKNTLIIGAGSTGEILSKEIGISKHIDMNLRCFIDDNEGKHGRYLNGVRIYGGRNKIAEAVKKYEIEIILLAIPSASVKQKKMLLNLCQETGCELRTVPGVDQLLNDDVHIESIRNVEIEDLLDREPINVELGQIMDYVSDKVVLVTGGGGSIGSEICRQIASCSPKTLVIFDIYENNAYDIQLELKAKYPELDLWAMIGSVRDSRKLDDLFKRFKPDIVFHAAAHKHVPLMEDSPNEAIKNNVFGTFKVATCADRYNVKKMVMISSDKAVNPTNIMGASKRLCEMVIQYFSRRSKTEFVAVRFGNVLGSNGSVIPLFKRQISLGGPVTVTSPDIIRYFMTIPEAVSLVLQAGAYASGGEIFVLDMGDPVSIDALAKNLIKLSGFVPNEDIMIEYTGLRPGEKLYEELLMDEEGMHKTTNSQIFIGSPILMDDAKFEENLRKLQARSRDNAADIKELVAEIVPTYQYEK